jgi:hypothetical protein
VGQRSKLEKLTGPNNFPNLLSLQVMGLRFIAQTIYGHGGKRVAAVEDERLPPSVLPFSSLTSPRPAAAVRVGLRSYWAGSWK